MGMTLFRRFRMEINFQRVRLPEPELPEGYQWVRWDRSLLDRHAAVKFESFRSEIDSQVFSCLGDTAGCQRLMREISRQANFLPEATWLIALGGDEALGSVDCGTIQGLAQSSSVGAVQNVGVAPEHRGFGLGRALVLKALDGFRKARIRRVYLEVTADNTPAVRLYRSIGFRLTRTMYKAVDVEPAHSY